MPEETKRFWISDYGWAVVQAAGLSKGEEIALRRLARSPYRVSYRGLLAEKVVEVLDA